MDSERGDMEHGDMIDASAYSVEELRKAALEGEGRISRPLAVALLARKQYPRKVADLQQLLADEREAPRIRVLAATALGEIRTPAAVRALERGLGARETVTLRGVAKALGEAGTRKHIAPLEKLAARPGPIGRDAGRALASISGRVRGGGARAVQNTMPLDRAAKPEPIRASKPADKVLAAALKAAPQGRLSRKGALALKCQGRELMFLFDKDAIGKGLNLVRSAGEAGMVAEKRTLEGVGWEPRYRVLTEPVGRAAFRVVVTTHDGRPVLAGEGKVSGKLATYHLRGVEGPGAASVDIRGRFDGQRIVLERAISATRVRPARTPAAARPRGQ